jgi:hypothetical protein
METVDVKTAGIDPQRCLVPWRVEADGDGCLVLAGAEPGAVAAAHLFALFKPPAVAGDRQHRFHLDGDGFGFCPLERVVGAHMIVERAEGVAGRLIMA